MTITMRFLPGLLICGCAGMATAGTGSGGAVQNLLNSPESIASLRALGPQGLEKAMRVYDGLQNELAALRQEEGELHTVALVDGPGKEKRQTEAEARFEAIGKQVGEVERRMERVGAAIDRIGGQRSCTVSRLYWYTDLEEAKAAAAGTGRPILSLRMLGKLTDEYSCANSRFFRTALYSNKKVSDFLRTHFVLHWESVRPVPRVTIDFGDGRKLERTLTGNSAHYVLASDGRPLDVLPGLYGPRQFGGWLERVRQLHDEYVATQGTDRGNTLAAYHAGRRAAIMQQWDADIERLGPDQSAAVMARLTSLIRTAATKARADVKESPKAALADAQSAPKRATAVRIMRFANLGGERLERAMDDDAWQAVANLHRENVKLDEPSIALMRREAPAAADAARLAVSKFRVEDPILRVVRAFEDAMALDTVRNEYLLHRRIHEEFVGGNVVTTNAETLNEWVYAELFLTPSSDPWLGLAPRDVYTALDGDGWTEPTVEVARSGR
jgi:hypothetical protein